MRLHGRYRLRARYQTGADYDLLGQSTTVSQNEVATLIGDAQRALGWSDKHLARKAHMGVAKLITLKTPLLILSLNQGGRKRRRTWLRNRNAAINQVVAALETAP